MVGHDCENCSSSGDCDIQSTHKKAVQLYAKGGVAWLSAWLTRDLSISKQKILLRFTCCLDVLHTKPAELVLLREVFVNEQKRQLELNDKTIPMMDLFNIVVSAVSHQSHAMIGAVLAKEKMKVDAMLEALALPTRGLKFMVEEIDEDEEVEEQVETPSSFSERRIAQLFASLEESMSSGSQKLH